MEIESDVVCVLILFYLNESDSAVYLVLMVPCGW